VRVSMIGQDRLEFARRRYAQERAKRLDDSRREIPDLAGDLASFTDDPHLAITPRLPVEDTVELLVVGAGFGGLLAGAMAHDAGVGRIRLLDSAGDVGGVWYWNRYPGARCDVDSYTYLPLLEDVGYIPTEKYAKGAEIYAHAQRIARHYDLYDLALFHTTVIGAEWDQASRVWRVATDRGDRLAAQFLLIANGSLAKLKLPSLPGLTTFKGKTFHTSRWDYEYTGGDSDGGLALLADKTVGIIGTGATALQCVPFLGEYANRLHVFQRTPATVGVRDNRPTDPAWAAALKPGWQAERIANFTAVTSGKKVEVDLVNDGWTKLYGGLRGPDIIPPDGEDSGEYAERVDFEKMEVIRRRIDSIVKDPATAEALKPYYRYLCKRPGFHDEYLDTFNRPNVVLVDTDGRGVQSVYEDGVIANGREYELDCLIFGTGFESGTPLVQQLGFDLVGRDGHSLGAKWKDGIATLFGLATAGFPNLFVLPGPNAQSAGSSNFIHPLQENAKQAAYVMGMVKANGAAMFEVTQEAEDAWVATIIRKSRVDLKFLASCTPGRFNNQGRPQDWSPQNANYGDGALALFDLLGQWRNAGIAEGLRFEGVSPTSNVSEPWRA
jgi:cation diffusion facilitator CzcD-associated flavoprotein CzcO